MQPYPKDTTGDIKSLTSFCRVISRYRDEDITDRNRFNSIFINGRKVGKIPTSHSDVDSSDNVGDFNITSTHGYVLVNDSGTAKWARWTTDVTW